MIIIIIIQILSFPMREGVESLTGYNLTVRAFPLNNDSDGCGGQRIVNHLISKVQLVVCHSI